MAIVQTVYEQQFIDAFIAYDRFNQFGGRYGLSVLYEYLEQLSDDIGEDIELDVIALCCDYTHYKSMSEVIDYYSPDLPDDWQDMDEGEKLEWLGEWLSYRTMVVTCEAGCIIFQTF